MASPASSALSDPPCSPPQETKLPSISNKRPVRQNAPRGKRIKTDEWDPENVLQNPNGPLITLDLKSILCKPEAWDCLKEDDRDMLLNMLPDQSWIIVDEKGIRRIDPDKLAHDQDWAHGIATYKEDVAEGRYDPKWLAQAYKAHEARASGAFDKHERQVVKDDWEITEAQLQEVDARTEQTKTQEQQQFFGDDKDHDMEAVRPSPCT